MDEVPVEEVKWLGTRPRTGSKTNNSREKGGKLLQIPKEQEEGEQKLNITFQNLREKTISRRNTEKSDLIFPNMLYMMRPSELNYLGKVLEAFDSFTHK